MGRPRSPNPKVHVSIVKVKRKTDDFYDVYEERSVYDPDIKNSRCLGRKKIGILPLNYTDLEKDLIRGVDKRTRAGREALAIGNNAGIELQKRINGRGADPAVFPLHYVVLMLLLASWADCTTTWQFADYWQKNKAGLKRWFADFPDGDVSPDRVHRMLSLAGKIEPYATLPLLEEFLPGCFAGRHGTSGGEELKNDAGAGKSPFRFDCIDTEKGLTLRVLCRDAKSLRDGSWLDNIELHGSIVVTEVFDTPAAVEKFLLGNKTDYVMGIKDRADVFGQEFVSLIENTSETGEKAAKLGIPLWLGEQDETIDLGDGIKEKRNIRVVPAALLINNDKSDFFEYWARVDEGCAAMVSSEISDEKTGGTSFKVRYYVSTLNFDVEYSAARISQLIGDLKPPEAGFYRVLDAVFDYDRANCLNCECSHGKFTLDMLGDDVRFKTQDHIKQFVKKSSYIPGLTGWLADRDRALAFLEKLLSLPKT